MTSNDGDLAKFKSRLKAEATQVPSQPLDHFPSLIAYECLKQAGALLADAAWAAMQSGRLQAIESLSMPRHGFGPRPVTVLSPATRVVYGALVQTLDAALAEPSRARGNWATHHQFGRVGDHSHVVDLDLTACYEFIDHSDLADELTLRSMDPTTVRALTDLLGAVSVRSRGLPQMLVTSDRLADTYLSMIDRHMVRMGYELHRYVDDYRVLANGWDEANQIVEVFAEQARELGLTLSSAKTTIRRRETVVEAEVAAETFLASYLDGIGIDDDGPFDPYDREFDDSEVEASVADAYVEVLDDWQGFFETKERLPAGMSANLGGALAGAGGANSRLSDEQLVNLVFDDPLRLESVCRYLIERLEVDGPRDHWQSVGSLVEMGRQSPWAKLWLLDTASRSMPNGLEGVSTEVLTWVDEQLGSPSELVRSEAAWAMAVAGLLDEDHIKSLYINATDLTGPAIAAAATHQGDLNRKVVAAIRKDSPLNEAACAWVGE